MNKNFDHVILSQKGTPLLPPIDQNVIQNVKSLYKTELLRHIISHGSNIKHCLKEMNLKYVVFSLAHPGALFHLT